MGQPPTFYSLREINIIIGYNPFLNIPYFLLKVCISSCQDIDRHTQTHTLQYVNISACLHIHTKQSFAAHPHSTLGIVIGLMTSGLMNASINVFSVMEPACFCLQGQNNPGSRMSTYVDSSTHQNPTGSTRPSNRKVKHSHFLWLCHFSPPLFANNHTRSLKHLVADILHVNESCFLFIRPTAELLFLCSVDCGWWYKYDFLKLEIRAFWWGQRWRGHPSTCRHFVWNWVYTIIRYVWNMCYVAVK